MFDLLSCGSNRIFFVIELFAILFEAARWAAPSWPCELFEQADERDLAKLIRCFRQAEPISQTAAETDILSAAEFDPSRAGIFSGVAAGPADFFRRVTRLCHAVIARMLPHRVYRIAMRDALPSETFTSGVPSAHADRALTSKNIWYPSHR